MRRELGSTTQPSDDLESCEHEKGTDSTGYVRLSAMTTPATESNHYLPAYVSQVAIQNTPYPGMIADTGSCTSLMTETELARFEGAIAFQPPPRNRVEIENVNGEPIVFRGKATLDFTIAGTTFQHEFDVMEGTPVIILGVDFLSKYEGAVMLGQGEEGMNLLLLQHPTVGPVSTPLVTQTSQLPIPSARVLRASSARPVVYSAINTRIPAWSEVILNLDAPRSLEGQEVLIQPSLPHGGKDPGFVVAHSLGRVVKGTVPIRLINPHAHIVNLPSLTEIAQLDPRPDVHPEVAPLEAALSVQEIWDELRPNMEHVDPQDDERIREWISHYANVFSANPKGPGCTHVTKHTIDTQDATPIHIRARRTAPAEQTIIDQEVKEMLTNGIIEPSCSPWSAPVVLVAKKDGSKRFCVDYRDLNAITKTEVYPIPRIADALDIIGRRPGREETDETGTTRDSQDTAATEDTNSGFEWVTTLDLASGYWQVRMDPDAAEKAAFSTRNGHYQPIRMPFGLKNAPGTFSRMMVSVLAGLNLRTCMVYLDDILIWSKGGIQAHLDRLSEVFDRLRGAGLQCKVGKCAFFRRTVKYLGHVISPSGVTVDADQVRVIRELPQPRTLTEVRAFLGATGYYRKWVKDYSRIALPLTKLLTKEANLSEEWNSPACQEAVATLKEALTTAPILGFPDFTREMILYTDAASTHGIGCILEQNQEKGKVVLAYWGRQLNRHEKNYGATEQECLAVVSGVKHFRAYLWGRTFRVVTDCSALKWLMTLKEAEGGPVGRLARWALKLQEYDFTIEHRPGRINCNADGISRLVAYTQFSREPPPDPALPGKQPPPTTCNEVTPDRPESALSTLALLTVWKELSASWESCAPLLISHRQRPQHLLATRCSAPPFHWSLPVKTHLEPQGNLERELRGNGWTGSNWTSECCAVVIQIDGGEGWGEELPTTDTLTWCPYWVILDDLAVLYPEEACKWEKALLTWTMHQIPRPLYALVACEYSGVITAALQEIGVRAVSADILPTTHPQPIPHLRGDVTRWLHLPVDLLIAHPPCTYTAVSGTQYLHRDQGRYLKLRAAIEFLRQLWDSASSMVAIEQPLIHHYARHELGIAPPEFDQPYAHGDPYIKPTSFFLRGGLRPLRASAPTSERRTPPGRLLPPSPWRGLLRSHTFPGIAHAIAQQWALQACLQMRQLTDDQAQELQDWWDHAQPPSSIPKSMVAVSLRPRLRRITESPTPTRPTFPEISKIFTQDNAPTIAEIRQAQQTDDELKNLTLDNPSPRKPHLVRIDQLVYLWADDNTGNRSLVPYIPTSLRQRTLTAVHDHGGHPGRDATLALLKNRAWWPNLYESVVQHIRRCHPCLMSKRQRKPGPLQSMESGQRPMEVIACDILGPLPATTAGSRYILLFVCKYSRWVEAFPFNSLPTTAEILRYLLDGVIARYGVCKTLFTDRGTNLISQAATEFYQSLGVEHRPSTAAHHETVGVAERLNATLETLMRTHRHLGDDWDDQLPYLLGYYRSQPQRSLGWRSPFEVMFQRAPYRHLHLPTIQETNNTFPSDADQAKTQTDIQRIKQRQHDNDARRLNSRRLTSLSFDLGDQVAVQRIDNPGKTDPLYYGPCTVVEVLRQDNYRLSPLPPNTYDVMHVSRLKRWEPPPSSLPTAATAPRPNQTTPASAGEPTWEVEAITGSRVRKGQREFRVHWRGWPKSSQSWEPEKQLLEDGCGELIHLYTEGDQTSTTRWEIGAIMDSRTRKGAREFLIHWKNFPPSSRTWEPEVSLREDGCDHVVDKYLGISPARKNALRPISP